MARQRGSVVATRRVMARTSAGLYLTGAVVVVAILHLPGSTHQHAGGQHLIVAVATAMGIALLIGGERLPTWSYHPMNMMGTSMIAALLWLAGGGPESAVYAALFVFIALDSFFFFAWPLALLHMLWVALWCLVASVGWHALTPRDLIMVGGTNIAVAFVTGWLVRAAAVADVDPLTGLPNRRGFDRALLATLGRADPLAVAFLDLDHFKLVNDRGGHSRGDLLLQGTAQAWRPLLPAGGLLCRYGGDEFAVLLPGHTGEQATAVIELLRGAQPMNATCSAGVAEWEPGDSASLLVSRADSALYQAKRDGRNRTCQHHNHGADVRELTQALRTGQLAVVYQPIVDLGTRRITGAEALVRWQHPTRGVVPPAEFIPIAEDSGLIRDLGRLVLADACRHAARWQYEPYGPRKVTVNVSGSELAEASYVTTVARILAETGLPPRRLVLELTESTLDADAAVALATLGELRDLGVRIAIDDFGTGYSTLSRLDRLPVDIVKIDRSFVTAIGPHTRGAPIVAAISALAHALGLGIVAEGVEEPHQAVLLAQYGCAEGQGWLYGQPGPPEELTRPPQPPVTERARGRTRPAARVAHPSAPAPRW